MARIPRNAVGGMVYHVLNRANGREKIFQKALDIFLAELLIQKDPKIVLLVKSIANAGSARSQIKKVRSLADYVLSISGGKIPEEYELKSELDF